MIFPGPWSDLLHLRVWVRLRKVLESEANLRCRVTDVTGDAVDGDEEPLDLFLESPSVPCRRGVGHARRTTDGMVVYCPVNVFGQRLGYVVVSGEGPIEASKWVLALLEAITAEMTAYCEDQIGTRETATEKVDRYGRILGQSAPMQALYRLIDRVGPSDSTVLIRGENGTGKELVAHAVHERSPRAKGSFVIQNCSAFNDNLLASELFGHKRGAFTGAVSNKPGLFNVADGGTFFLDEIGDTSPALQVKLLRVLQEGTFLPVGDTVPQHVDVRIVAATNKDLMAMVEAGTFREDLYYRLNVINILLPALRDRRDDIPLLTEAFLEAECDGQKVGRKRLSPEALEALLAHSWPGNVRELQNEIERLVVMSGDDHIIHTELLNPRIRHGAAVGSGVSLSDLDATLPNALAQLERSMIITAMRQHRWNKTRAAKALGISRRNLIRKVQSYGLERRRQSPTNEG